MVSQVEAQKQCLSDIHYTDSSVISASFGVFLTSGFDLRDLLKSDQVPVAVEKFKHGR